MFAGIETGGTKTVCAVGSDGRIEARAQFPTGTDPAALVTRCAEFFAQYQVTAAGLGTFGPCDTDPESATYGQILATPKPGWPGTDIRGLLEQSLNVPVSITADVAAAALGEAALGAGRGARDVVYLTIGTGVGAGIVLGGRLSHGAQYAELGHMLLPQFGPDGVCTYHGGCFEGLASGPAMNARLGFPASELRDDDPAWDFEAQVVAAGLHNIVCATVPEVLVIGGGVGSRAGLHARLPRLLRASLAGYLPVPNVHTPGLGADSGVVGALLLAESS